MSRIGTVLSLLVTAGGAFLAFDAGTPWEVRLAAALSAAAAGINEVVQQHVTARRKPTAVSLPVVTSVSSAPVTSVPPAV